MIPSVQDFLNLSVVSDRGPHALAGSQRAAVQVFELLLFEGVSSSVVHLSFRGDVRVFPRVCATEQPLRKTCPSPLAMTFPARISMSGRHDRKTQSLLMFGFDRNGLQVGQVTSWVFVVGVSPFFPVFFGFTGCKLLVLCKHGTPRAPYISRATAFIAL